MRSTISRENFGKWAKGPSLREPVGHDVLMLKGKKVTLRALETTDIEAFHAFVNDVDTHVLSDDEAFVPLARQQVEKNVEKMLSEDEIIPMVIEADGKLIGTCGIHHIDLHSRTCSFGIAISDTSYRGKGYGRDTVEVLLDYVFRLRDFRKIWLTVYADNEQAIRSYKSLGFVQEGLQKEHVYNRGEYKDWVIMALFRRDWDPSRKETV
jgi:diamine N-acetyltransferase